MRTSGRRRHCGSHELACAMRRLHLAAPQAEGDVTSSDVLLGNLLPFCEGQRT